MRKAEHWADYSEALIEGLTVRRAAKACGLSKNTAFRWRHRFLALTACHVPTHESSIIEANETFFLESFKVQQHLPRAPCQRDGVSMKRGNAPDQIPVLVVRDRSGQTTDFQLDKLDAAHVQKALRPLIDTEAVLCTDGPAVHTAFARMHKHHPLGCSGVSWPQGARGSASHPERQAYHSQLKSWMARLHGLATRYLPNYLSWRYMLERYSASITPEICLREALSRPMQHVTGT